MFLVRNLISGTNEGDLGRFFSVKNDLNIIDITGISPCQRGVAGVCNDPVLYV